jgi:hypothetical protein
MEAFRAGGIRPAELLAAFQLQKSKVIACAR